MRVLAGLCGLLVLASCGSKGPRSFTDEEFTYTGSGFTVSAASIDFKDVRVGESEEVNFSVTNDGGKQTSINFSHTCPSEFSFKQTDCLFLEPGSGSCTIDSSFNPRKIARHSCLLTIVNDEGDKKTLVLSGNGVPK